MTITSVARPLAILLFAILLSPMAGAQSSEVGLIGGDLSAWRGDTGNWFTASEAFTSPENNRLLASLPGTGVILNGPDGRTVNILSEQEFGDVEAHIEFMVPVGSNSGVYFLGRYEVQVLDSSGVQEPKYSDCGGIYQRWNEERVPQGFQGHAPRFNASLRPGEWQTFDVLFRAPRFDASGKKIANACFVKVVHNDKIIHENVEVYGPTRACAFNDEQPTGPLMLQGDHGPVAYRDIRITPANFEEHALMNRFFAMDTGTKDEKHQTPEAQAQMLAELGYDGIGYSGFDGINEMVDALDARGLEFFNTYTYANIEPDGYTVDPKLKESVKRLRGRDAMIWLIIKSATHKPSSPEGDAQAVRMVQEVADICAESGVKVALYPHTNHWLERVEDAVRIAQKADRKNVGATFNLCHWLKVDGQDLRQRIEQAMPKLFVVTINGADPGDNWDKLIQNLDQGSFDNLGLLKMLHELNFTGPIGLQGYGIGGDVHENLRRSIEAWKKLSAQAVK